MSLRKELEKKRRSTTVEHLIADTTPADPILDDSKLIGISGHVFLQYLEAVENVPELELTKEQQRKMRAQKRRVLNREFAAESRRKQQKRFEEQEKQIADLKEALQEASQRIMALEEQLAVQYRIGLENNPELFLLPENAMVSDEDISLAATLGDRDDDVTSK